MDRRRATVFGEVAATYDRLRPRYPAAMFDDLAREAGLGEGSRVLEIGIGTGIATADLLGRRFHVTAVDPDPRMLDVARDRLGSPLLQIVEVRFEDFTAEPGSFDLVLAAGSWHWVDAEKALPSAASFLRPQGSLAVAWNLPRPESSSRPAALDAVYRHHAPELAARASQVRNRDQEHRRTAIADSGRFEQPVPYRYRWSRALSTRLYCDLLATHSDHRMLGPERLARLLDGVAEVVERHGGSVDLRYETVMYVARLRGEGTRWDPPPGDTIRAWP